MRVYIGIDWSQSKHDICFLNESGEVLGSLEIEHTMAGFVRFDQYRQRFGVMPDECVVGLETAHNLLVDYLWDQGYSQIYVLPPNGVKSAQGRFRQSGAKDDPWDGRLIADILRTDLKRYSPWQPDRPLTRRIRAEVRYVLQLNKALVRHNNQLQAVLWRYYPAATQVFGKVDGLVSLAFIQAYPTPQAATALSFEQFKTFLRAHHHTHPRSWAHAYSLLQADYPTTSPEIAAVFAPQASGLAQLLEVLVTLKKAALSRLAELYAQHPDHVIYERLPAAGELIEPALLAKLGDDRTRFPTPRVLQAVAGTCPVTIRSGKFHKVFFRQACDHAFRTIVQQWARLSLQVSPWADAYYRSVRPRCSSDSDAIRRLANRWLEVVWKLWHDHQPYDEEYHLKQRTLRAKPN